LKKTFKNVKNNHSVGVESISRTVEVEPTTSVTGNNILVSRGN